MRTGGGRDRGEGCSGAPWWVGEGGALLSRESPVEAGGLTGRHVLVGDSIMYLNVKSVITATPPDKWMWRGLERSHPHDPEAGPL